MANLNLTAKKKHSYDAIVIGSGASGGWAAKELCDRGLKTLVLERGRGVKHIVDYPTASKAPWEFEYRGSVSVKDQEPYGFSKFMRAETLHWRLKEDEQPVVYEKPFRWYRGYHEGGKSLLWARQTQRWSDFDFEGPARDGFAVDWPIRYEDMAPWYDHVEKFAGICGFNDDLPELPNSIVQPGFELNCVEKHFKQAIESQYKDGRRLISGRAAHLTDPQQIHFDQGRGRCMSQRMCNRGCNYGGYFSSNASTLPWAAKTGNMTLRPDAVVHSIIYDDKKEKATGVRIVDANTREMLEFYAKVIFVNGSAINSNAILLNSTSDRFPNGLGNDSGVLGKYIAWHNYRGRASGRHTGFKDKRTAGGNPSHAYIPRFRNLHAHEMDFLRGYATGIGGGRGKHRSSEGIGDSLRDNLLKQEWGDWHLSAWMMGETIPVEENHIRLHEELKDKYGIPQIVFSCDWTENDDKMVEDFKQQIGEMFERAGCVDISVDDSHAAPGSDIHEMGGVRMGKDPKSSMLNAHHQLHACKNVFVTDGACMTSTSTQNPTLTYMAFSARAANFAADELKKRNL
ncbi:GMC family oxidoreductase [Marinilongibacter aquaticus]|uniref:GMC oxidoreductase n=1 Tax=Marinilongibacter aquaticus TaxID=2975157 RepID=UPI0021BD475C|nr:GMC family oxidoreductase [Marinilongibacter aquaticus]UBM57395.1 GMC family oxidoreductase [Marinilongibacter aquaticus]